LRKKHNEHPCTFTHFNTYPDKWDQFCFIYTLPLSPLTLINYIRANPRYIISPVNIGACVLEI
jgi:hypothetical protein